MYYTITGKFLIMKKWRKKIFFSIVILLTIWLLWGNYSVDINHISVSDEMIPSEFRNYKIVQISDLHNANFGNGQNYLIKLIKNEKPDIIVITGDLIDSSHTNINAAINLISGIINVAPVYYVTGNHEAWCDDYQVLKEQILSLGVIILDDEYKYLEKNGQKICLAGLNDPDFTIPHDLFGESTSMVKQKLNNMNLPNNSFTILLAHRPELINAYSDCNINLVLSGHAHGGQFRIPFIGGLVAPNQGFFPKYTSGKYIVGNTQMIVSRGLGNSIIPLRINNRPEVVVITLN